MNKNYQKLILAVCMALSSAGLYAMRSQVETKRQLASQAEIKANAQEPVAGLHEPEARLGVKIVWSEGQEILVPPAAAQKAAVLKSLYEMEPIEGQPNYEFNLPDNFKANNPFCSFAHLDRVATYLSYSLTRLDTTLLDCTAADLLQIYKLSSYLGVAEISAAAIKALPQTLAKLAQESGLQAVKNFLDALNFNDQEASAIKKQLIQNNPWIRYCCGEPTLERHLDIPAYFKENGVPFTSANLDSIRFFGHVDDLSGIALHTFDEIRFPWGDQGVLQKRLLPQDDNVGVNLFGTVALHPDKKHALVILLGYHGYEEQIYFWSKIGAQWQRVEIDANRQVRGNRFVRAARWISDDELVTIAGETAHYWKLQGDALMHERDLALPADTAGRPQWNPCGTSFIASDVNFVDIVVSYRDGQWQRAQLQPQDGWKTSTEISWDPSGTILYGIHPLEPRIFIWRLDSEGQWQGEQYPIRADVKCIETRQVTLSAGGSTLFIYNYDQTAQVLCLRLIEGEWRQVGVFDIDNRGASRWKSVPTHAYRPMFRFPEIVWNRSGDTLFIHSTRGDAHVFKFDKCDRLSLKELLLYLVGEKLKESTAGQTVLKREEQILKEIIKTSPVLKKALGVKPKWYTKEGITYRAQKIQRWIKKNPKAALALCVAGGLLAYYAKKRLVPRVKKSIIMPLAARLKRKASK